MEAYIEPYLEEPILKSILENPKRIIQIPKELYDKFYRYLLWEERYEDIIKLKLVENKVTLKTLDEVLEETFLKSVM